MIYKVLIVEDEPHQQEALSNMLKDHFPEFGIIEFASSIEEGERLIHSLQPDLVFLDVMLPPATSFDLLDKIPRITFEIIFTTSYEEFAVRAFRLSAVDYLLKPIDLANLSEALQKFRQRKSEKEATLHIRNLLENIKSVSPHAAKVALATLNGYIFVNVKDIVRCESDNTYSTFFTIDKKKIIVSKTLKECEQMLTEYGFFRVHNSHLINTEYIVEYTKGEGGVIRMSDGSCVDVSRRRKDEFFKHLQASKFSKI